MPERVLREALVTAPARLSTNLPKASPGDTILTAMDVFLPTLAKGVIMRRPAVMALAERFDIDRRAIRRMQRLKRRYGPGPLLLRVLGRSVAMILDSADVHRVLGETPAPFSAASREKIAALAHFEPQGVLISRGAERTDRRLYNEEALDVHRPIHRQAGSFARIADGEVNLLRAAAASAGELNWGRFSEAWFSIVRQVLFGRAARMDNQLSVLMSRLRRNANWAFLWPKRTDLLRQLLHRIGGYLREADPESLAGFMAGIPATPRTAPEQQVPQWLFAFDAAGMAIFRALALLASHPDHMERARQEISRRGNSPDLPYLRSVVLDSIRLWPTSPLILRESLSATKWQTGIMPANTAIVIFTPFFHRDEERLPFANRFSPELWSREETAQHWGLIPFSEGPAACPGRELVLLLATSVLASLLANTEVALKQPGRLRPDKPLPATLNHFGLRFALED